jgi:hypothetical protein
VSLPSVAEPTAATQHLTIEVDQRSTCIALLDAGSDRVDLAIDRRAVVNVWSVELDEFSDFGRSCDKGTAAWVAHHNRIGARHRRCVGEGQRAWRQVRHCEDRDVDGRVIGHDGRRAARDQGVKALNAVLDGLRAG